MSSAMVFLMRHVDTTRNLVNSLTQFWVSMEGRAEEEIEEELVSEWRRVRSNCNGDEQAAIEFLTIAAIVPFTDQSGVLWSEDRDKVRPRIEMLTELDMKMEPHRVQHILDIWEQFAPDDELQPK